MTENESLRIEGWAVDNSTNEPAAGIDAVIDGKKIVTGAYGVQRPDVAVALGSSLLKPSGFVVTIPGSALSKGVHDVSLRIFTSDGTGYYLIKDRVRVTVD